MFISTSLNVFHFYKLMVIKVPYKYMTDQVMWLHEAK